jgi:hypothetical protein
MSRPHFGTTWGHAHVSTMGHYKRKYLTRVALNVHNRSRRFLNVIILRQGYIEVTYFVVTPTLRLELETVPDAITITYYPPAGILWNCNS